MILPFEYWPSLRWMQQLIQAESVELEQWGTYQKQSGANRCKILSDKGVITLSVPLTGGREQKAFLNEIYIDGSQRWQVQHLRAIKSCYGKAPYFEHYFPHIEKLLIQPYNKLMDLNYAVLQYLAKCLKFNQPLHLTDYFQIEQAAKFKSIDHLTFKPYLQVFADKCGFVSNLSVLDALLCLGPYLHEYLATGAT